MRTIGFVKSRKENEKRIALFPEQLKEFKYNSKLYFEKGYGEELGIKDSEYSALGANVTDRKTALNQSVICDPKIGDAEYLNNLENQIIFGWVHAVQNKDITDKIIKKRLTAFAWEDMYKKGRHVFWRNNEIAGEAAIVHAYMLHGVFPYNTKVAIIGRGNVARGALKTLNYMGAEVISYDKHTERLLREEISKFDVIVNAILWDTTRKDHIIYKEDLKKMKPGSMIIDISCDRNGAIETSIPTTIEKPDYFIDDIRHYVVDHTPSLFYKTTSQSISEEVIKYLPYFIEEKELKNEVLQQACCIKDGEIRDKRIINFQER